MYSIPIRAQQLRNETTSPSRQENPLDVLIITQSSLREASAGALDRGSDDYQLSAALISCDEIGDKTADATIAAITKKIARLRKKQQITDNTRIVINLPGMYADGQLLSTRSSDAVRLDIVELCAKIRSATGNNAWTGTIHVSCDSAGQARSAFQAHPGSTIIHGGEKKFGLTQRHHTLSLLAEAWNEAKQHTHTVLDADKEFQLVSRFSGESSTLVRHGKIDTRKPEKKWMDGSEASSKAGGEVARLLPHRGSNQRLLALEFARNLALAKLRHGSADKFIEALENNPLLEEDELFQTDARKYIMGLHIERDFSAKLGKLIDSGFFKRTKGWKEELLLAACKKGDAGLAALMIRHNANADCRDASGLTPLLIAARSGDQELVKQLLIGSADPKKSAKGLFVKTPSRIARETGSHQVATLIDTAVWKARLTKKGMLNEALDLLLGIGEDKKVQAFFKHAKNGARRRSLALKIAATTGDLRLMGHLVAAGVKVDQQISGGKSALHYAARAGNQFMVSVLISQGADPTQRSAAGTSPLAYAIRSGSPELVERLLRLGARLTGAAWFSRQTIEKFAAKGWLARPSLRALVIDQLARYRDKYQDHRVIRVLADCLPADTRLSRYEARQVQAMIKTRPASSAAMKLKRMMPTLSPDGSGTLSTASGDASLAG